MDIKKYSRNFLEITQGKKCPAGAEVRTAICAFTAYFHLQTEDEKSAALNIWQDCVAQNPDAQMLKHLRRVINSVTEQSPFWPVANRLLSKNTPVTVVPVSSYDHH